MNFVLKNQHTLNFLSRVLGYREGDGPSLAFFVVQGVLIQAGIAGGLAGADALFLNKMGSSSLPALYAIMPLFMILFIPLLTSLMDRIPIRFFMESIHIYLAASGFFIWFLLSGDHISSWFYYILKLHGYMWMVSIYSIYWNQVDHYYTALEARRLNPVLSAALSGGSMLGGYLSSYFAIAMGVTSLFFIWGSLATVAFLIQKIFGGKFRLVYFRETSDEKSSAGSILHYALLNRYGFLLSFAMLLLIFMTTMAEFFYLDIFSKNITDADDLAAFLGTLFFQANLLNLLINLVLYRALLRTPGFFSLIPLQSLLYLIVFLWLYLDYGMHPAMFAFFIYQGIQLSIDLNNWNFLYNPVPEKIKHGLRSFVEGISDPIGTSIAGLSLILLVGLGNQDGPVLLAFFASIPALGFSVGLRSMYSGEMISKLKKAWIDLSLGDMAILSRRARVGRLDSETSLQEEGEVSIASLEQAILSSLDEGMILHFLQTINRRNPTAAFAILRRGIRKHDEEDQRAYRAALRYIIQNAGAGLMGRIRSWVRQDFAALGWHIREELALSGLIPSESCREWLENENGTMVTVALAGLMSEGGDPDIYTRVWERFNRLYQSDERKQALWLAGEISHGGEDFLPLLLAELSSPDRSMRITALHSILHLASEESHGLAEVVFRHLKISEDEEMELCMEILIRTQDISILEGLLRETGRFGPAMQRKTFLFIRNCGLKTIPILLSTLQRWDFPLEARGICARATGLLSPAHLEAVYLEIAENEIPGTFRLLLGSSILADETNEPGSALTLWSRHYEELYHRSLRFLIQLLSSTGRIGGAAQVQAALKSEDQRARAYALESLQAALPASIYRKIVPFVERSSAKEKVEYFVRQYPDMARDRRAELVARMTEPERLEGIWSETDAPGFPDPAKAEMIARCTLLEQIPARIVLSFVDRISEFSPENPPIFAKDSIPDFIPVVRKEDGSFEEARTSLTRDFLSRKPLETELRIEGKSGFLIPGRMLLTSGMRHPDFFLSLLVSEQNAEVLV